jgi:hypothetical protein
MPKRSSTPPTDPVEAAAAAIARLTGSEPPKAEKNPYAVALGRLGGLKGGHARAEKVSKKRLSEIGKKGAKARWRKKS